jgi:hypothetical protein
MKKIKVFSSESLVAVIDYSGLEGVLYVSGNKGVLKVIKEAGYELPEHDYAVNNILKEEIRLYKHTVFVEED